MIARWLPRHGLLALAAAALGARSLDVASSLAVSASAAEATRLRRLSAETRETCMDIRDECVKLKSELCVSFGVPLYHSDCMQAIQDKCWPSLAQIDAASAGASRSVGPFQDRCEACA